MKPAAAASLLARARALLASGRPEMGADESRSPVGRYLDEARHLREVALMRRRWQAVAPASVLAQPGSWWSGDVLGVPLLLTRDGHGTLRAFLNVCRHRGARVVAAGEGCARERFSCPYHAWSYAADGALVGLPRREGFPGLRPEAIGLRPVAVLQRAGIVWVIPDPDCVGDHGNASLGAFVDELEGMGLGDHVAYAPRRLDVRSNWKLVVEGAFESYHVKTAHRDTIAPMFADNVQVVDEDGLNRRVFFVKENLRAGATLDDMHPREVGNLLYYFFPGTVVLVQPDHAQVTRLEPLAVNATRIVDFALIPEVPTTERARTHWDRNVKLYRDTFTEDYAQFEAIQAGLATGANEALRFGRFESALARFNEQLDAQLATVPA